MEASRFMDTRLDHCNLYVGSRYFILPLWELLSAYGNSSFPSCTRLHSLGINNRCLEHGVELWHGGQVSVPLNIYSPDPWKI